MRHSVPATGDTKALRSRFVAEAIAAIGQEERFDKASAVFRLWLDVFKPFSKGDDFNTEERIVLPSPYYILIEPAILYGYYRAWLRRYGAL